MNNIIDRRPITNALKEMLVTVTGRPIDVGRAPVKSDDQNLLEDFPFAIIYPIPGGSFWGAAYHLPESEAIFEYQVTSVGERPDQTEWMGDMVRSAILGRGNNGEFVAQLDVVDVVIQDRMPSGPPGGLTPEGTLFNMVESYLVKVGQP